jgi:hypothetical protein
MPGPDLTRPDPAACIHKRLAIDVPQLLRHQVALITCDGTTAPLASVAKALRFPVYYGHNWDAMDECLGDLDAWWPAKGWVLEVSGARGELWRTLDACWRRAAASHAAAGRSLHLVYS